MADSHTLTSAARLVRCHFDLLEARIHELTLPLILQRFMEAFCYIWKAPESFVVLNAPSSVKVHAGSIRIPGGTDAARISVGCRRDGDQWQHFCAMGSHPDLASVQAWVDEYANAYEAEQIWVEPPVFALYRTTFQLEHTQFQTLGFLAGRGLEAYNAALAGVRWGKALAEPDPKAAYSELDARLPARMQVSPGTARQVYVRSQRQPRVACPQVISLRVLRQRASLSAMEAVVSHLVHERGFSMPEVAERLGVSKGTIQRHADKVRKMYQEAGVDLRRHKDRMRPVQDQHQDPATGGGDADSEE